MTRREQRELTRSTRAAEADRRRRVRDFTRTTIQQPMPALTRLRRSAQQIGHQASSAHVQAAYPAVSEPALGTRGTYIGDLMAGGLPFCYDPWILYSLKIISDANAIIIGKIGFGKSALIKCYCWRQHLFGRICEFIDPKSEYGPLVAMMGGITLRLEPGGTTRLNPISRVGKSEIRAALLEAIARAMLNRPLHQHEAVGLGAALRAADAHELGEVCIPHVVEQLRQPTRESADHLGMTIEEAKREQRDCMLALVRLCEGPLRGMFDAPTTLSERVWDSPAVSLDLSAMNSVATGNNLPLAITMICASAFLDSKRRERHDLAVAGGGQAPNIIRANDEGWRALHVPGIADFYCEAFKFSRASGVQHVLALHRLSDLEAAGDTGTRTQTLAKGLLDDASTIVVYRQSKKAIPHTAEALDLTDSARNRISNYRKGQALWVVGERTLEVQHRYSDIEWPLIDTDAAMATAR